MSKDTNRDLNMDGGDTDVRKTKSATVHVPICSSGRSYSQKHLLRRIRQAVDLSFVRPLVAQIHEKGERPRLSFS